MYSRLIQFTLLIPVNKRKREFNFRQRTATLYDVNTTDEAGERYYFTLVKENEQWLFGTGQIIPQWLKNSEEEILAAFTSGEPNEV